MNENIDLTKILEGCPKGTEFYSSIYGKVRFEGISNSDFCPIEIKFLNKFTNPSLVSAFFAKDGRCSPSYDGECTLFPAKDQRDWSKFERFWDKPKVERFDPKTFQPFDKVLARCTESEWMPTLFGFLIDTDKKDPHSPFVNGERVVCVDIGYHQCIPYNDDTKHLVGTTDEAPDFYRYWED